MPAGQNAQRIVLLLVIVVAAVLSWIADALLTVLAFDAGPLARALFHPTGQEAYTRAAGSLVTALAVAATYLLLRHQQRTRRALAESEARFAAITAAAPDAVVLMDSDGRITFWNAAAERVFGYRAAEALGRDLHALLAPPERRDNCRAAVAHFGHSGEGAIFGRLNEFTAIRRDGSHLPVEVSVSAVRIDGLWQSVGIIRDVSDKQAAYEDLELAFRHIEKAHREWLDAFDAVRDPMLLHDRDGRVLRANRAYAEKAGVPIGEVPGRLYWELFPRRDGPLPRCLHAVQAEDGYGDLGVVDEVRLEDGSIFLSRGFLVRDADGSYRYSIHIMEDVTAQRRLSRLYALLSEVNKAIVRADEETALLEAVCRIVTEHGHLRLAWFGRPDPNGECIVPLAVAGGRLDGPALAVAAGAQAADPSAIALFSGGYAVCNDILGDPRLAPLHAAALAHGYRAKGAFAVRGDGVLSIHAESAGYFTDETTQLFRGLADDVAYALDSLRNRRERHHAERALRRAHQKLALHIERTPLGVVEFDSALHIVQWNAAAERIFGYPRAQVVGRTAELLVPSHLLPNVQMLFRRLLDGEGAVSVIENLARDGRRIHCEWYSTPLTGEGGEVEGAIALVNDITALVESRNEVVALNRTLEQRVEQRTRELEAANRELESFSYSVSHDLRTPLRAIDGFSQLLGAQCGDERTGATARDYLERIRAAAQRMGEIIDDLLDLARVGRTPLTLDEVDLSGLARLIVDELARAHPQRVVETAVADGITVRADRRLLRIALENLIGNAWKFTEGSPHARIEVGSVPHPGGRIIYVRDNGIGFDMRYVDKLFGAFQRLHAADQFPGAGIGLATVHRIIDRHGGNIWAESKVGEGATFYFTVPRE